MRYYIVIFLLFIESIALFGCKSHKMSEDDFRVSAQELYQEGVEFLELQDYAKAERKFNAIFYMYPGNSVTPYAELMEAYADFMNAKYDDTIDIMNIFIKMHPMHSDVDYAFYLKSLSYYVQISPVSLDQANTVLAKGAFEDLISRFPNTKYALDAKLKLDLINDHLAGQQMYIGRYYLAQNNPIAAFNRFQNVINHYSTTSHIPEALYRAIESLMLINLREDAEKYAAVLGYNYQNSTWYKYAYNLLK
ncbi:MAG: outer membrane protein assembly factor BamD [Rickettsiaceae bacterium]